MKRPRDLMARRSGEELQAQKTKVTLDGLRTVLCESRKDG